MLKITNPEKIQHERIVVPYSDDEYWIDGITEHYTHYDIILLSSANYGKKVLTLLRTKYTNAGGYPYDYYTLLNESTTKSIRMGAKLIEDKTKFIKAIAELIRP